MTNHSALFFEQRFGEEMVNRLIEPLFSGIYAGDLKQMSLRTTYPAMEQLLDTHGSLLKGLRKQQKQFVTTGTKKNDRCIPNFKWWNDTIN
ncbi:FAD-dependent oxidoreductase [Brochothrix campestris]|uniref:Protoporphyrinogen oxidase n=1 Tax=Brochothrix campestris FSL F6-1037 TaxID=1265861 RepID=W7CPB4_9LIST|nr:FAD-dependent oxidoreductase [Brochothrix campestris]EUJ38912.1 protoporphyrinogen oxidase [Brochothrix campestris FSL F6-1037]